MIEFHGDIDELRELTKGIALAEPTLKKATVSALNKSITSVRTYAVKQVAREYNIKQKDVRKELTIIKATLKNLHAKIGGEGSPGVPLYKFSPTPNRVPSTIQKKGTWEKKYTWWGKELKGKMMVPGSNKYSPKLGIKVMIHRGTRKMIRTAFIARMPSGHVGMFSRAENGRWGLKSRRHVIEELYGPSPLRIITTDRFYEFLEDYTQEVYDKNMAHEAEFYLKRAVILPNV